MDGDVANLSLHSGERQVAPTLKGIRGDHVARYRFAAEYLASRGAVRRVIDAGCGIGYGARLLADAGMSVLAVDRSSEAIAFGQKHYGHDRIGWECGDICSLSHPPADAAVALEILEHLQWPGRALDRLPRLLIASVPNELVMPKTPGRFKYHVRHYTPAEFEVLLTGAGYEVKEWRCQVDMTDAPLRPGVGGRTIIAVAARA